MTKETIYISIEDAAPQLEELYRRAIAGDDIILTREGRPVVKLVPEQSERERLGDK